MILASIVFSISDCTWVGIIPVGLMGPRLPGGLLLVAMV
jgi:hypothetical protein